MPDYGHDLLFGSLLTPTSESPHTPVALAQVSERAGLDLATFQDHPYQPEFLDAWSLIGYALAATTTIAIAPNVINLPLRPPAVLARAAISLDLLSGGRFELAMGAGLQWDKIAGMGGRRMAPAEAVQALDEAIDVVRGMWQSATEAPVRVSGQFHSAEGALPGPAPAHDIGIWIGAYKRRMLWLTGRKADGWLPSLYYLGDDGLARGNAVIDEACESAGRRPESVRRLLNIVGSFDELNTGMLHGAPARWVDELAQLTLEHGVSVFILKTDDPTMIECFGHEVAPAVRELVAHERRRPSSPAFTMPGTSTLTSGPTAWGKSGVPAATQDGPRRGPARTWNEADRPVRQRSTVLISYSAEGRAAGQHLIDVHDGLRAELAELLDVIRRVKAGGLDPGSARSAVNKMTIAQNNWALGAFCVSYCRHLTAHHALEDEAIFPYLRSQELELSPVLDRLQAEHRVIHDVLEGIDQALLAFIAKPGDFTAVDAAVDLLTDALLSHLAYEEEQLVDPLARFGFYPGQLPR
jgi:hypothetical protein